MKWSKEEIQNAINLHKQGKRFEEIAQELKRETRSVDLKLKKYGLYAHRKITSEKKPCKYCGNEFLSQKKDKRKFCSQRCSAISNNKNRGYQTRSKSKYCENCRHELGRHQYKYCSIDCQNQLRWKKIIEKIENGITTLYQKNYKKYLIHKYGNKCMKCEWDKINPTTGLVPIQLEHKDGNSENHDLKNLELLCPNCHSLTPTYGALNKGNGRTKRRETRRLQKINEQLKV
jgi:hypothetical protein